MKNYTEHVLRCTQQFIYSPLCFIYLFNAQNVQKNLSFVSKQQSLHDKHSFAGEYCSNPRMFYN